MFGVKEILKIIIKKNIYIYIFFFFLIIIYPG